MEKSKQSQTQKSDLTLYVLLRNDDYVKQLERSLEDAKLAASQLADKYQRLQRDYTSLSYTILELMDLLKSNGIKYRKGLDGVGYWK